MFYELGVKLLDEPRFPPTRRSLDGDPVRLTGSSHSVINLQYPLDYLGAVHTKKWRAACLIGTHDSPIRF
jgi:hypothetical protein